MPIPPHRNHGLTDYGYKRTPSEYTKQTERSVDWFEQAAEVVGGAIVVAVLPLLLIFLLSMCSAVAP